MIAGPPPGRISMLFTAWANWLFDKLSPPAPARIERTQPPQLVKSDRPGTTANSTAGSNTARQGKSQSLRSQAR